MTDKEWFAQALEALELAHDESLDGNESDCRRILMTQIAALRERLALPVQEPVVKVACEGEDGLLRIHAESETCDVCAPKQPRQWVDLSDKEIHDCDPNPHNRFDAERIEFARTVLVKFKEKNT